MIGLKRFILAQLLLSVLGVAQASAQSAILYTNVDSIYSGSTFYRMKNMELHVTASSDAFTSKSQFRSTFDNDISLSWSTPTSAPVSVSLLLVPGAGESVRLVKDKSLVLIGPDGREVPSVYGRCSGGTFNSMESILAMEKLGPISSPMGSTECLSVSLRSAAAVSLDGTVTTFAGPGKYRLVTTYYGFYVSEGITFAHDFYLNAHLPPNRLEDVIVGDVNFDRKLDQNDLSYIMNLRVGNIPWPTDPIQKQNLLKAADVDRNGAFSPLDASALMRILPK